MIMTLVGLLQNLVQLTKIIACGGAADLGDCLRRSTRQLSCRIPPKRPTWIALPTDRTVCLSPRIECMWTRKIRVLTFFPQCMTLSPDALKLVMGQF